MLLTNSKPYYQFIDNQSNHTWIVVSGWSLLGSFVIKPVKKSKLVKTKTVSKKKVYSSKK